MEKELAYVRKVRKCLFLEANRVSEFEIWLGRAERLLEALEQAILAGLGSVARADLTLPQHDVPVPRPRTNAKNRREEEILRSVAERGIDGLVITWRSDGSADILIEGAKPFTLKPGLAELLDVISVDDCADDPKKSWDDDLVGWKRLDDVASCLSQRKGGPPIGRRAVIQRISKLREALRKNGINPFLVLTGRRKGVRFARRRRLTKGDHA